MSRGMSRGGSGFPIIIAVLGVLILAVIGIFIYMQLNKGSADALDASGVPTMEATTQTTTDIPTLSPEPTSSPTQSVVTVPPSSESPTSDAASTATPNITQAPSYDSVTVWINVDALKIHTQANFTSETVGKIPYQTQVSGDKSGKWLNVSYEGTQGYVYLGKTSAGRACVVYSAGALEALAEDPDAEEVDLVTSITQSSNDADYLTVQIQFSEPVYSDDNKTGALTSADFTITGATPDIISSGQAGTSIITVKVQHLSSATEVKITVKAQSIFNAAGKAAKSESFTLTK